MTELRAVYISDYGNVYVSEDGTRVIGKSGKELSFLKRQGYVRVRVGYYDEDHKYRHHYLGVHRLVAEAFIPNPNDYLEVNHIDGDKTNNDKSNLEWCTRAHNIKHAFAHGLNVPAKGTACHTAKLSPEVLSEIRSLVAGGMSMSAVGRLYGVSHTAISGVIHRTTWKSVQ